jgi:hypothetical protein
MRGIIKINSEVTLDNQLIDQGQYQLVILKGNRNTKMALTNENNNFKLKLKNEEIQVDDQNSTLSIGEYRGGFEKISKIRTKNVVEYIPCPLYPQHPRGYPRRNYQRMRVVSVYKYKIDQIFGVLVDQDDNHVGSFDISKKTNLGIVSQRRDDHFCYPY